MRLDRAIAILAVAACAAPASAQIMQPADIFKAFSDDCLRPAPDIQTHVPKLAQSAHWDELGHKPGTPASKRAWLVAVNHTAVVVDIELDGAGRQVCSASTTTVGLAIAVALKGQFGHPADFKGTVNGLTTLGWRYKRPDTPPSILSLSYAEDKPLVRMSLMVGATTLPGE